MRNGRYQSLAKDDIKYLKQYAEYFTCVSHYKYAEMNNLEVEEVLKDLESGKIKYLKKFTDTYNNVDVYIIHKWQWLDTQNI